MIKTILFDWGGVIADDPDDDFLGKLLRELGATDKQVQDIFKTYMHDFMRGKITEPTYWQKLRNDYGFTIDDSISQRFMDWNGLEANQEVLDFAKSLQNAGYKIAIFSNVIEPTYNVIKRAGYYEFFDEVIASFQVGYAKPDPEIYQLALTRIHSQPEECLFIDDKETNLIPAREVGMNTILAKGPKQIIEYVRQVLNASPR